jgi:hypothetical protein
MIGGVQAWVRDGLPLSRVASPDLRSQTSPLSKAHACALERCAFVLLASEICSQPLVPP